MKTQSWRFQTEWYAAAALCPEMYDGVGTHIKTETVLNFSDGVYDLPVHVN